MFFKENFFFDRQSFFRETKKFPPPLPKNHLDRYLIFFCQQNVCYGYGRWARAASISDLTLNLHTHGSGTVNQDQTIGESFLNSLYFKYGYTPTGRTIYVDGLHTNIIGEFSVDEFLTYIRQGPQSFKPSTWKFRRLIGR